MRDILSNAATGTASAAPATDLIGVMPDLQAIVQTTLNLGFDDVYLRDFAGDTGDPHSGPLSTSPDIIVLPAGVDNFIYARVRNRGSKAGVNAQVTV